MTLLVLAAWWLWERITGQHTPPPDPDETLDRLSAGGW